MDNCCVNGTKQDGWHFDCVPFTLQLLFGVISIVLLLSLVWNVFCCVSKCCSGKWICTTKTRRRRSPRQMEENPIYGNLNYMQTSSLSLRDQHRVNSEVNSFSVIDVSPVGHLDQKAFSKTQDCYANLTLKAPKLQSGRSSPQIQYSDVVHLEEPPESEKEDEGNADTVSCMSDLYASVQNQRTKIVDTAADSGEGYANHL